MSLDEASDITEEKSVWGLVHTRLRAMVKNALNQTGRGFVDRLMGRIGLDLSNRLDESLRHVGYGHRIDNENDTVHHEVDVAVDGALHDFNVTDVNGTFQHALVAKLDQEIELDAFSKVISNMTGGGNENQDFFHKMPVKDETLFVALVSMGIIVPIIILTLCGIYFYRKKKEKEVRREEMLLRDSSQFTIDFSSEERDTDEHKGNAGEDVADLDFRQDYQA